MGDLNEQTIVISDLLSFLSCNIKLVPKEKLLKVLQDYYLEKDIKEGHKTLLASLPVKKSTRHGRRVKNPDPLLAIYECFMLIQSEDLPIFVCKNLNNVPDVDIVKAEPMDVDDLANALSETEDLEMEQSFAEEQKCLKSQISDIATLINKLRDELNSVSDYTSKEKAFPQSRQKRKKLYITDLKKQTDSKNGSNVKEIQGFDKREARLSYLQSLIDEDEGKSDGEESALEYDINQDSHYAAQELEEFDEEADSDTEYLLNKIGDKELEGRISISEDTPTMSKSSRNSYRRGNAVAESGDQKVIFIKTEENENSIEITSSSDYFRGFDVDDASNMISLEMSKEEEDFKGEIELMVNDDKGTNLMKDGNVLKTCSICGDYFSTQKKLDIHVKSHCVKKIFDCILCDEGFLSKEQLQKHFEQCLELTKKKYNLDAFPCPTCGRLYAQERALKQHSYMHSESRPFGCPHCTYRYLTKNSLEAHIKTQHNVMNKFFCPFCDNSYISVGFLKNHIKSHTGERPFACKECGYKASTADLLKRHMLTHGPPKEFKCDLCEFICLGIGKLSRHKAREHKRENIFCTICGKEFNNSCVYHKHYMSHVGARPYPCSICSYAAISKEVLTVHMRTHTGDNIINCPNCSVPFGTKYSLKRHLKSYCVNRSSYYSSEYVI